MKQLILRKGSCEMYKQTKKRQLQMVWKNNKKHLRKEKKVSDSKLQQKTQLSIDRHTFIFPIPEDFDDYEDDSLYYDSLTDTFRKR